jgi:membrane-associated phospholipid phosphatase
MRDDSNLIAVVRRWLQQLNRLDVAATERIALTDTQRTWKNPLFGIVNVGAHLGDSLLWLAITGVLWKQSAGRPEARRHLIGWIISLIATLGLTLGIKRIFRRRRPGGGRFLYGRGPDVHSFPSGHGSRSGVILIWASLLHPLLGKFAPLLVLWIIWSRVAIGIHYVGDVLVGFLMGLGVSKLIRNAWQSESKN